MTEFKMLFVRLRFHFAFVLPTVSSVSPPSNPSECRDCANPSVRNLFVRWCGMVIGFSSLWLPGAASIAGPITAWNSEFLNAARLTSGLLVSGAPEVAREMAIVDSAMFDAANAASGLVYKPVAYTGGAALGVSVDAAALAAGYVSMQAIFGNSIWAGAGGSPAVQSTILANIQAAYDAGLSSLGIGGIACAGDGGPTFLCDGLTLGTAAANANLIARGYTVGDHASLAADGSAAAIVKGLLTYTPPGSGTVPGVYVPPSAFGGRPAMFPEWGTVTPFALTAGQLASIVAAAPGPPSITSATYAEGVFRSECQGSGTSLPASIASVCAAAGIAPQTTTQAAAALFWNDPGVTAPGRWLVPAPVVWTLDCMIRRPV